MDRPEKIELKFICLSENRDDDMPGCIILGEENSDVKIPIIIGETETRTLSSAIKGIKRFRPTAHDLFVEMANNFGISLKEVFIYYYEDGVYKAELVMESKNGSCRIDARPSDAINILQKFNAPIYTTKEIIDKAGIVMDNVVDDMTEEGSQENTLGNIDTDDLREMLDIAIKNEEYEKAAVIHAEIKHRTENEQSCPLKS